MISTRRGFLTGLGSLLAAPAIVHAGNLMPVKVMKPFNPLAGVGPLTLGDIWNTDAVVVVHRMIELDLRRMRELHTFIRGTDYVLVPRNTRIGDLPRLETAR